MDIPNLTEWIQVGRNSGDTDLIVYKNRFNGRCSPVFVGPDSTIKTVRQAHETTTHRIYLGTISLAPVKSNDPIYKPHLAPSREQRD